MSKNTKRSCVVMFAISVAAVIFQIFLGEEFYNLHLAWGMLASTVIEFVVGIVMDLHNGVNPFK